MRKALIFITLLLAPPALFAQAQGSFFSGTVQTQTGLRAGATITVCSTAVIANSPTGATESSNTVTITTNSPHGFVAGQIVQITGITQTLYNGTFTVLTVPTNTTFTYTNANAGLGASGQGAVLPTNVPCTPAASIFSDIGLTAPLTQPIFSTGLGNFGFYASPGLFVYTITGQGILLSSGGPFTFQLPCIAGQSCVATSSPQTWTALQTFNAGLTSSGPNTLNGGGTLAGTWAGNPNFSGTPSFTGTGNTGTLGLGATALGANNAWTGNETHTGTETFAQMNGMPVVNALLYPNVQAAVNALGGAGTVIVPPGTFAPAAANTALTITSGNVHIVCSGMQSSFITYTGSTVIPAVIDIGTKNDGTANQFNDTVEGCTVSGNANATSAIRTRGAHHATFKNLDLRNVTGAAFLTSFAVSNEYDNIHTSLNDAAFTTQPTSCIQLDGPDSSHKSTASTIKNPVCEGVSGTGIVLGQTIEITIIAGTSEQNARGLNNTVNALSTAIIGTDFEQNSTEDILDNGVGLLLHGGTSCISATKLHAGSTANIVSVQTNNNTCTITNDAGAVNMATTVLPQVFNATPGAGTCPTAAAVGATCTTAAVTIPLPYNDTNWRASCTGLTPTNVPIVETYTKSGSTFTITVAALTAAAASFASFDCQVSHN